MSHYFTLRHGQLWRPATAWHLAATVGGHHAAMTGYGWLPSAGCLAWLATCFWPLVGYISFPPVLCGPSIVVLTSKFIVPSMEECFGWLNRCGYAGA
jgi:hypothetical protein